MFNLVGSCLLWYALCQFVYTTSDAFQFVNVQIRPSVLRQSLSSATSLLTLYSTAKTANPNVYDDGTGEEYVTAQEGLRYFREYTRRGMERFMQNDLEGALLDFERAMKSNSSQPLMQRGIALYCAGHYQNASIQLLKDIEILEHSKLFKASDLRIWLSATYNKLGEKEKAIHALDNSYLTPTGLVEQRFIINCTLSFFAGEKTLEDMLTILDEQDEKDVFGHRFFGNFYLGLFHDSIGEYDLAKTFLSFTRNSNRYPDKDMWYHVPRVLFSCRGWDEADEILS